MSIDTTNAESVVEAVRRRALTSPRTHGPLAESPHQPHGGAVLYSVPSAALIKALDATRSSVFFLSRSLDIVDANDAACRCSGYSRDELRTMCLDDVIADDASERFQLGLKRALSGDATVGSLPARQRSKEGGSLHVQIQLHFVDRSADSLLVAVVEDAEHDLNDWKPQDASRDYLTSLPARGALEMRFRRAERRARRRGSRFAILFIDIDHFKYVNDTAGHRAGDRVLQTLGQRLLGSVRPGDFVARYGGDEFVAVIEGFHSDDEVEGVAERLRAAVSAPIDVAGQLVRITASVGMAVGASDSSAESLLDEADQAMYRAKRSRVEAGNPFNR